MAQAQPESSLAGQKLPPWWKALYRVGLVSLGFIFLDTYALRLLITRSNFLAHPIILIYVTVGTFLTFFLTFILLYTFYRSRAPTVPLIVGIALFSGGYIIFGFARFNAGSDSDQFWLYAISSLVNDLVLAAIALLALYIITRRRLLRHGSWSILLLLWLCGTVSFIAVSLSYPSFEWKLWQWVNVYLAVRILNFMAFLTVLAIMLYVRGTLHSWDEYKVPRAGPYLTQDYAS